ncbi:NmrA family NAD(P)-binding protein [Pleomorphomonas sp. JP5]|uniref:NmrA family NAD(P)-binding protein n=1 Tax=Pleomorphomonas sp. JP5 TaxID=2942998 RepID=UPI0020431E91|nr:NmrA family NAD(P)-binding protein [Pleomorphomonas sp. JP5]MCM5557271.1 NAD(P)H-binding protein [Pleomorphomonas sp. JP5]
MYIVMGATGNVGGAVADALLARGEAVTVLVRAPERAAIWRDRGARIVKADAEDPASLKAAFASGKRAFLLNPPAAPSGDTDRMERRTIANVLAALEGSGLEKVVAASTYGAQSGEGIGDLSTLWELEEGLRRQSIPAAINRGGYYMTNWTGLAEIVRQSGRLPSMYPADTPIPTVSPRDLGEAAADRLVSPLDDVGVVYVEGPQLYTPQDVADAFSAALGREIGLDVTENGQWEAAFKGFGFSDEAARSYARMTAAILDGNFDRQAAPRRGKVTLADFISSALAR